MAFASPQEFFCCPVPDVKIGKWAKIDEMRGGRNEWRFETSTSMIDCSCFPLNFVYILLFIHLIFKYFFAPIFTHFFSGYIADLFRLKTLLHKISNKTNFFFVFVYLPPAPDLLLCRTVLWNPVTIIHLLYIKNTRRRHSQFVHFLTDSCLKVAQS